MYQRAILVPSHTLDHLYRDYEAFENSFDKNLARKVRQDLLHLAHSLVPAPSPSPSSTWLTP